MLSLRCIVVDRDLQSTISVPRTLSWKHEVYCITPISMNLCLLSPVWAGGFVCGVNCDRTGSCALIIIATNMLPITRVSKLCGRLPCAYEVSMNVLHHQS